MKQNTNNKTQTTKYFGILIVALILAMSILPSTTAIDDSPNLKAKLLRYTPVPAQPGQYVTAYIQIDNTGAGSAKNAAVKINEQFPFQLVNAEDSYKEIGLIQGKSSYTIEYKIKIDSQALIGTNTLEIEYTDDASKQGWKKTKLSFNVKNTNGALQITSVTTNPEEILPGEKATITLFVKNNAETTLWNVAAKLNLQSTTEDIPFIPTATTEQNIASIPAGETQQIKIPLKAYPNAEPGYYKIPLELRFTDDDGTETTQSDIVGIIIKAEPELKAYLKSITTDKGETKIQVQFVNKGISDLKFLDVELEPNEAYTILDASQRYVGDLDSDDYRTETYTIATQEKEIHLQMKTIFRDGNNKKYEQELQLQTTIPKEKKSHGWIVFVILILGIVGYFIFKKKK